MSRRLSIAGLCAVMAITFSVLPADARKKEKQPVGQWPDASYASDRRPVAPRQNSGGVPSFDGRTIGRGRTCGYDIFESENGAPVGPYCH